MRQLSTNKYLFLGSVALLCGIILSSQALYADSDFFKAVLGGDEDTDGYYSVDRVTKVQGEAESLVAGKAAVLNNQGVMTDGAEEGEGQEGSTTVYMGSDGRIDRVIGPDGERVDYNYSFCGDVGNTLDSVTLNNGDTEIVIGKDRLARREPGAEELELPVDEPIDLEEVARKGLDFDYLNKAFDKLYARLKEAREKFYKGTETYYSEMERMLKENRNLWEDSGISLEEDLRESGQPMLPFDDVFEPVFGNEFQKKPFISFMREDAKKNVIDAIIAYIYSRKPEKEEDAKGLDYIFSLERVLGESVVHPNIKVYKAKSEKAVDIFLQMVDSMMKESGGAKIIKEGKKIEAIIMLPAGEKQKANGLEDTD